MKQLTDEELNQLPVERLRALALKLASVPGNAGYLRRVRAIVKAKRAKPSWRIPEGQRSRERREHRESKQNVGEDE